MLEKERGRLRDRREMRGREDEMRGEERREEEDTKITNMIKFADKNSKQKI